MSMVSKKYIYCAHLKVECLLRFYSLLSFYYENTKRILYKLKNELNAFRANFMIMSCYNLILIYTTKYHETL